MNYSPYETSVYQFLQYILILDPPINPEDCLREKGFCVTSSGSDQNEGVIIINSIDGNTEESQLECLNICLAYPGSTGCEVIWNQNNRGCYIHTKPIARGNLVNNHYCWVFSKCYKGISNNILILLLYLLKINLKHWGATSIAT